MDSAVSLDDRLVRISVLLGFAPFRRIGEAFLTRYVTRERVGQILRTAYYPQGIVTAEVVNGYYDRLVSGQWEQSLLAMTRGMSKNTISFPLEDITSRAIILWGQNDT